MLVAGSLPGLNSSAVLPPTRKAVERGRAQAEPVPIADDREPFDVEPVAARIERLAEIGRDLIGGGEQIGDAPAQFGGSGLAVARRDARQQEGGGRYSPPWREQPCEPTR